MNVCCILTLVYINIIDEIILGISQDEKINSLFVGYIFFVHPYSTVPAPQLNFSLIKITMIPKDNHYFKFIIEDVVKIMYPMILFSTEKDSSSWWKKLHICLNLIKVMIYFDPSS